MDDTRTPPTGVSIFAPQATVDRIHQEEKLWKEGHAKIHEDLSLRMRDREHFQSITEKRLDTGERRMETFDRELTSVTRPSLWKAILLLGTAAGSIAIVTWSLAQYPSKKDFEALRGNVESLRTTVEVIRATVAPDVKVPTRPRPVLPYEP